MIILIGMPGSGKTTVMNLFERVYAEPTADIDSYIENEHGNISKIFADYGEEYFRDIETRTIKKVFGLYNDAPGFLADGSQKIVSSLALVSTGGGSVLREENVKIFKEHGKIVYLRANPETLLKRLEGDKTRPLLQGGMREKLTALFETRSVIYERVADVIIDTDGLTPEETLKLIFEKTEKDA